MSCAHIKRYLSMRDDNLPWLFLSERCQPLTRQAVNYFVARGSETAPGWATCIRTCCGIPAATISPTRATICASCRTISATAIHVTPCTTRGLRARFEGLWKR